MGPCCAEAAAAVAAPVTRPCARRQWEAVGTGARVTAVPKALRTALFVFGRAQGCQASACCMRARCMAPLLHAAQRCAKTRVARVPDSR